MKLNLFSRLGVFAGLVALPLSAWAQQPPQQQPPQQPPQQQQPPAQMQQQQPQQNFTQQDKQNFEKAFPEVKKMAEERDQKLQAADDPNSAKQLQEEYFAKMVKIIEKHDLTVDKFNGLASSMQ